MDSWPKLAECRSTMVQVCKRFADVDRTFGTLRCVIYLPRPCPKSGRTEYELGPNCPSSARNESGQNADSLCWDRSQDRRVRPNFKITASQFMPQSSSRYRASPMRAVHVRPEDRSAGFGPIARHSRLGVGRSSALPAPTLAAERMLELPTRSTASDRGLEHGLRGKHKRRQNGSSSESALLAPCFGPRFG